MDKNNQTLLSTCKIAYSQYLEDGNMRIYKNIHMKNMESKPHTPYCIVHRFYEYFKERFPIEEIHKCKGKFGCDFFHNKDTLIFSQNAYKRQLNMPCTYFNIFYTEEVTNIERDEEFVQTSYSMNQLVTDGFLTFNNNNMCLIKQNQYLTDFDQEFITNELSFENL